ncbi:MAG: leucine-rich repeat domain-containing protein [Prevotella sp.]|nr:leucine-rich repeat domain-containing protein [Prevotella sp.]
MNNGIYKLSDDGKTLLGVKDKNISEVVIPDGVTHIGKGAFYGCEVLPSIDIPNSVTHIGNAAFYECESLRSINIPNSVTYIGNVAFYYCESLQSIDIPNSVTYIGEDVFEECTALQSIDIPNSVTHIGDYAFSGCEALQSIHIRITDIDSCCVKESAFDDIDFDNCILYIPSGTRCTYRHHPVFRRFKNIEIERIK